MVLVGEAHAQPAPDVKPPEPMAPAPAPPTSTTVPMPPPAPAEAPSKYPTAHAQRPLMLPAGGAEGGLRLLVTSQDVGDDSYTVLVVEPHGRYGLGPIEIEAAAQIFVTDWLPESFGTFERERLQTLSVAGRYLLGPDSGIGVELTAATPVSALRTYRPMLTLQHKEHLSSSAAVVLAGGAGLDVVRFDTSESVESSTGLAVEGSGRAQAQLTPGAAIEALVGMRYSRPLDGGDASFIESAVAVNVEVGVVASLAPGVDITAAIGFLSSEGVDQKLFTLGVVTRRIP